MPPMSISAYAKSRGAGTQTIRDAVARGQIQVSGGRVDPAQADQSWGRTRRSNIARVQSSEAARQSAESKIFAGLAKLRAARDQFETARDQYIPRDAAAAQSAADVALFRQLWSTMPERRAAELAGMIGIEVDVARILLDEFVRRLVGEFADLEETARRLVAAAR
jgi:hypothetical protein